MPKKSKTTESNAAIPAEPVTSTAAADPAVEAKKSGTKKTGAKKPAAKKTGGKSAAKKSSAKRTAGTPRTAVAAEARPEVEPTDDEIRIRAYFIAERRMQLSLDGDPANDWIQARQELIAEQSNGSNSGNGSH